MFFSDKLTDQQNARFTGSPKFKSTVYIKPTMDISTNKTGSHVS